MTRFDLHLVSDSTGETLDAVAKAAIAQFKDPQAEKHLWPMVRSLRQLEPVLESIRKLRGPVMFTLVNQDLRDVLIRHCEEVNVPYLDVLDPAVNFLSRFLGEKAQARPGQQHALNTEYFDRIEAMNYTMAHDDGQMTQGLNLADVVVVGVSRTSKTPTCIYLANRGIKAANIPIVKGCPLPAELFSLTRPLVVALVTSADRLIEIRRNRLASMNESTNSSYADPDAVREELLYARRLIAEHRWPAIDVTRRSIEETAGAIIQLMTQRRTVDKGASYA